MKVPRVKVAHVHLFVWHLAYLHFVGKTADDQEEDDNNKDDSPLLRKKDKASVKTEATDEGAPVSVDGSMIDDNNGDAADTRVDKEGNLMKHGVKVTEWINVMMRIYRILFVIL